jgi:hypothetical protein
MDFINPESAEKYVEKAGMKKTNVLLSRLLLIKEEKSLTPFNKSTY